MRLSSPLTSLAPALLLLLAACASGDGPDGHKGPPSTPDQPNGSTKFESDFPVTESTGGDDAAEDPAAGGDEDGASDDGGDGAERAISEADVVQVVGDRLYTLSRAAGLGVIDLSNPRKLRLL